MNAQDFYYRPKWTCGRYNGKRHVALMYNLLEGVVHFFEDMSADVINILLATPKNAMVSVSRIIELTKLDTETVNGFLEQLLSLGLLSHKIPNTSQILQYRTEIYNKKRLAASNYDFGDYPSVEDGMLDTNDAELKYAHAVREDDVITSVMFELTYNCSEKCIHCYNIGATRNDSEQSGRNLSGELTFGDYKKVIDELYDQGLVKVCLSGGDPFSKKDVWDIIAYLNEKEIAFDVFTNGQRLIGLEDKLASYYPRLVGISIYSGIDSVHDGITRIKGSLQKSLSVMARLCSLAVPMNLKCCVMRPNIKTYRTVFDIARKYNAVPQIEIDIKDSITGDKCVSTFLKPTVEEYNIILRDKNIPLYVGLDAKNSNGSPKDENSSVCGAGFGSLCITPVGDVIPCCSFHLIFGNIKESSISDILTSNKRIWWLSCPLSKYEECNKHEYCAYCNLCPGANFSENGTPLKVSDNICFLSKIRCELANSLRRGNDPLHGKTIDEALQELKECKQEMLKRVYGQKSEP